MIPKKKKIEYTGGITDYIDDFGFEEGWNSCHEAFSKAMIDRLEDMFANAINGVVLFEDVSKLIQELEESNGE